MAHPDDEPGDTDALPDVYSYYDRLPELVPHIRRIAAAVARQVGWRISVDDLLGEGLIGALEAAQRYDPIKGDFRKWVGYRARGAMIDAIRRSVGGPRRKKELIIGESPPEVERDWVRCWACGGLGFCLVCGGPGVRRRVGSVRRARA